MSGARESGLQARYEKRQRDVGSVGARCPYCGKTQFTTRSAAKRCAKRYPTEKYAVYRCPHDTGFWHLGHLSPRIKWGYETRLERYG